jgi:hypothetical protein
MNEDHTILRCTNVIDVGCILRVRGGIANKSGYASPFHNNLPHVVKKVPSQWSAHLHLPSRVGWRSDGWQMLYCSYLSRSCKLPGYSY